MRLVAACADLVACRRSAHVGGLAGGLVSRAAHSRPADPARPGLGDADGPLALSSMVQHAIVEVSDCTLTLQGQVDSAQRRSQGWNHGPCR